jgi:hypothetical protein
MNNEENKPDNKKSDTQFWLHGLYYALIITTAIYAVISLFTFMWAIGCIILFIYLWVTITLYLWYQEKKDDQ